MAFNWYAEKAALRAVLNSCIRQGLTYEETKAALNAQYSASCTVCVMSNMGNCYCDTGHNCYVEQALKTYLRVAKEKLSKEA